MNWPACMCIARRMDVGGHRNPKLVSDLAEQSTTGVQSKAAKRFEGSPIGLVIGSLEDPRNTQWIADPLKILGNRQHKFLGLDDAGTEYINRLFPSNFHALNVESFHDSKAGLEQTPDPIFEQSATGANKTYQEP